MNRFTARQDDGVVYCRLWNTATCENQCDGCTVNEDMLNMLARYEDTNLMPDEIESLVATFIALTSAEYGKQRFFQQENGTWYDCDKCDHITTSKMILRAYLALEPCVRT